MKKGKIIAGSVLSIIMCSSLIAGATMALFTSESTTNIAVTSGNVSVVATSNLTGGGSWDASEKGVTDAVKKEFDGDNSKYNGYYLNNAKDVTQNSLGEDMVTFTNTGTATLSENKLTLDRITPGDSVNLTIDITNYSNVSVYYRIKFYCDNEYKAEDIENKTTLTNYALFDSLNITIPIGYNKTKSEAITYTKKSLSGVKSYTTAWMQLDADEETNISSVPVSIDLPLTIGNSVQNRTCDIYYIVEAVQGNANIGDNQMEEVYINPIKSGTGKVEKVEKTSDNTVADDTTITLLNAISNNAETADTTGTEKTSVTVTIPKSALQTTTTSGDDDNQTTITKVADSVQVNVTSTTIDDVNTELENKNLGTVSVTSGSTIYALDIDATVDGNETTTLTKAGDYYVTSFTAASNVVPTVYHINTSLDRYVEGEGDKPTTTEYYTYNVSTGEIVVYTKSFSPFVISYLFGGGLGTSEYPYLISSVLQLQGLAATVNLGVDYSGKYFELTKSLSLNGVSWTSIGTEEHPFNGTFNGNGRIVNYVNTYDGNVIKKGTFAVVHGARIIDLYTDGNIIYLVDNDSEFKNAASDIKDGQTIKLTDDITVSAMLDMKYNITFDLGGHQLTTRQTGTTNISGNALAKVTVDVKNGTINANYTPYLFTFQYTTLNIENVTFNTYGQAFSLYYNSSATIKNSTFKENTVENYVIVVDNTSTLSLDTVSIGAIQGIFVGKRTSITSEPTLSIINSTIKVNKYAAIVGGYNYALIDKTTIKSSGLAIQVSSYAKVEIKNSSEVTSELNNATAITSLSSSNLIIDNSKVNSSNIAISLTGNKSANICNGSEITATSLAINMKPSAKASITNNSKISVTGEGKIAIQLYASTNLSIKNSEINATAKKATGIYYAYEDNGASNAQVKIEESQITAYSFAVSSSAVCITGTTTPYTQNIKLSVSKSTLTSISAASVLLNVPIANKDDVKIEDSYIYGAVQAVIIRGGKATIQNTTLGILYDCKTLYNVNPSGSDYNKQWNEESASHAESEYSNGSWGDGNKVYSAALVLGDCTTSSYAYDTEVVLDSVVFTSVLNVYNEDFTKTIESTNPFTTAIYAIGKTTNQVTLTINGTNDFGDLDVIAANEYVTINNNDSNAHVIYKAATEAQLTKALSQATSGDTIELTASFEVSATPTIPEGVIVDQTNFNYTIK